MVLEHSGPAAHSCALPKEEGLEESRRNPVHGPAHGPVHEAVARLLSAAPVALYKPPVFLPVIANLSSCTITGE